MFRKNKQAAMWLLLGLFALILAACTGSGGEPAVEQAEAAAAGDETAVEEAASAEEPEEDTSEEDTGEETAESESEAAETAPEADDAAAESADESEQSSSDSSAESETDNPAESAPGEAEVPAESEDGILTDDSRTDLMLQITAEWLTDWNRHTVPYDELVPVLRRDGIQSLDEPTFESLEEAAGWLEDEDPVISVDLNGEARAYPLRIINSHEIVNDNFGDLPVVITYCPLCNSALVFDSRLDGEVLEFGTSGWLRHSDLIMYDRTTDTLWQQFTGDGIVGELAGKRLTFLPSSLVSFADFSEAFPEGTVLSIETGFGFPYDGSSYAGYDTSGNNPFLFFGEIDPRLPTMERVVSVSLDDVAVAYPVTLLSEEGAINDSQGGQDMVVFHTSGTSSAFFNPLTSDWDDVGATGVFDPNLDGEKLSFSREGDTIVDDSTGSSWNILGQAVDGPLTGQSLEPIVHGDHFWFSWAAFQPDTIIYGS